jgi:hypothetical protein
MSSRLVRRWRWPPKATRSRTEGGPDGGLLGFPAWTEETPGGRSVFWLAGSPAPLEERFARALR